MTTMINNAYSVAMACTQQCVAFNEMWTTEHEFYSFLSNHKNTKYKQWPSITMVSIMNFIPPRRDEPNEIP